jgi:anti-sigma factor RsiW
MEPIRRIFKGSREYALKHMPARVDGELQALAAWRFSRHLAWCSGSQAMLESLQATVVGLRPMKTDGSAIEPNPHIAEAVRERIVSLPGQPES